MKQFASTIKQKYWDMKIDDVMEIGYFWEYKNDFEFWRKRLNDLVTPCDGVLLVGSKPNRIGVIQVKRCISKNIEKKYSDGVITTTFCYAIKCIPMADAIPEICPDCKGYGKYNMLGKDPMRLPDIVICESCKGTGIIGGMNYGRKRI